MPARAISVAAAGGGGSTTPPPPSGTDPRFSYCYQVIAAGYGPYYRGIDPEYACTPTLTATAWPARGKRIGRTLAADRSVPLSEPCH